MTDTREFVLWGFSARQLVPIKLSGGTLRECRARQTARTAEGWTCGIYLRGAKPEGLRLRALECV